MPDTSFPVDAYFLPALRCTGAALLAQAPRLRSTGTYMYMYICLALSRIGRISFLGRAGSWGHCAVFARAVVGGGDGEGRGGKGDGGCGGGVGVRAVLGRCLDGSGASTAPGSDGERRWRSNLFRRRQMHDMGNVPGGNNTRRVTGASRASLLWECRSFWDWSGVGRSVATGALGRTSVAACSECVESLAFPCNAAVLAPDAAESGDWRFVLAAKYSIYQVATWRCTLFHSCSSGQFPLCVLPAC